MTDAYTTTPLDRAVDEAMNAEWSLTKKNAPDPVTEGESVGEETSNAS